LTLKSSVGNTCTRKLRTLCHKFRKNNLAFSSIRTSLVRKEVNKLWGRPIGDDKFVMLIVLNSFCT